MGEKSFEKPELETRLKGLVDDAIDLVETGAISEDPPSRAILRAELDHRTDGMWPRNIVSAEGEDASYYTADYFEPYLGTDAEAIENWLQNGGSVSDFNVDLHPREFDDRATVLLDFVAEFLNYVGGTTYSDEEFRRFFRYRFEPLYTEITTFEVIWFLDNLDCDVEEVKLSMDKEPPHPKHSEYFHVAEINLVELTDWEMTAVVNRDADSVSVGDHRTSNRHHEATHCLRFRIRSKGRPRGDSIVTQVLTAFRLFAPRSNVTDGEGYVFNQILGRYIDGIPFQALKINRSDDPMRDRPLGERLELDADRTEEFLAFWNRYQEFFRYDEGRTEYERFHKPIGRFLRTFRPQLISQDYLVDCMLGFEVTLLKDFTAGYNYRFPLRAACLLSSTTSFDASYIHTFFRHLYQARNATVHSDDPLDPQEVDGETLDQQDFILRCRYFLARTILTYLDQYKTNSMNIHETNEKLEARLVDVIGRVPVGIEFVKISSRNGAQWHLRNPPHCHFVEDAENYIEENTVKPEAIDDPVFCGYCQSVRDGDIDFPTLT